MILSGFAGRGRNLTSPDLKAPTDPKVPAEQQAVDGSAHEVSARGFSRGLGLFDSTMIVAGGMIGSAIFIVSADMSRQLGSSGWLLLSWVIAGVLTPDGERFGVVSRDDVLRKFGVRSWVLTSEDELRDQLKQAGMAEAPLNAKFQHAREWMSTLIFAKRAS